MASSAEHPQRRLLLDTHVWLWMISDPQRLRAEVQETLRSGDSALFLSAASCWEIAIKHRLGKLPLPEPPAAFVPPRLLRDGVALLPIDAHHALAVADLPDLHSDPFDRLLVAQARAERLTLVTVDEALLRYDVDAMRA
jgi:PIN domain nuclease of toxin-antitoxin system